MKEAQVRRTGANRPRRRRPGGRHQWPRAGRGPAPHARPVADSLDFLNFVVEIDNRTGLQTSQSDYPKLTTLSGCMGYLSGHPAPA